MASNNQGGDVMGIMRDKTKLAVAAVKGDETQELYVAVTKATLQDEVVPKEKHVRTLKIACSAHAPRQQVEYVIYKLGKRLGNSNWLVALKALMVFHRLMRECDPGFQEQMLRFADRTGRHHMLCLDRYADHSSRETWDYSAWIRVYSIYLAERLDAYRTMRFDPEQHATPAAGATGAAAQQPYANGGSYGAPHSGPTGAYGGPTGAYGGPTGAYGGPTGAYGGPTGAYSGSAGYGAGGYGGAAAGPSGYGARAGPTGYGSYGGPAAGPTGVVAPPTPPAAARLKDCPTEELLQHLPRMQRLLKHLVACVPEGAAGFSPVILTAASWVLKESRAVYKAASEGVMNLADKFFEMERAAAVNGLELYKEHLAASERLNAYYGACQKNPALSRVIQYPQLQPLPSDFLATMEEYIKEAPREGAGGKRMDGPVSSNKVSDMAARGGTTSSAFGLGSTPEEGEGAEEEAKQATPKAEQQPPTPPAPPSPPKATAAVVDLLSWDDSAPEPVQPAAPSSPPGELDFLAAGMTGQQQQQPASSSAADANGFEPGAFTTNGHHAADGAAGMPSMPGGYPGYGPGGYGGYQPQMTGYPMGMGPMGYAPQMTGYPMGGNPFMMQDPNSMALVPVGNPMMTGALVPYGMMPGSMPYAGATGNPFGANNPFAAPAGPAGPAGANAEFPAVKLANDPLNAITEELLGPGAKAKAQTSSGPQPSLKDLKQQRTSTSQVTGA